MPQGPGTTHAGGGPRRAMVVRAAPAASVVCLGVAGECGIFLTREGIAQVCRPRRRARRTHDQQELGTAQEIPGPAAVQVCNENFGDKRGQHVSLCFTARKATHVTTVDSGRELKRSSA